MFISCIVKMISRNKLDLFLYNMVALVGGSLTNIRLGYKWSSKLHTKMFYRTMLWIFTMKYFMAVMKPVV